MNRKYYSLTKLNKVIAVALIVIISVTVWGITKRVNYQKNVIEAGTKEKVIKKSNNISICYNITIGDEVDKVNIDVINAAIQGMFDYVCMEHLNVVYPMNTYVLITNVQEISKDNFKVNFVSKEKETDNYPTIGYSFVTVEKQESGSYKGIITNVGGSIIRENKQSK
jgi:hypothetical protein